jgi:hypothetical protein
MRLFERRIAAKLAIKHPVLIRNKARTLRRMLRRTVSGEAGLSGERRAFSGRTIACPGSGALEDRRTPRVDQGGRNGIHLAPVDGTITACR